MGRPSKLTKEITDKLVLAISQGNYYEAACLYAGIDYSTFRLWMKSGENAKKRGPKACENNKYFEFFEVIKRAEGTAEVAMVAEWRKNIPRNWQAARDFLARRYPERWMPRQDITSKDEKLTFVVKYAEEPEEPKTNGILDITPPPTQEAE